MRSNYTIQKFYWILFVVIVSFSCNTVNAKTQSYECTLKSNGLSHHLSLKELDGELIEFGYVAVSLIDNGPPFPSCGIDGSRHGDNSKETRWEETSSGLIIRFNDSADKNDKVIIKRIGIGYNFYFNDISPLNCGPSSGIAEEITLKFNSKKCKVVKIRN